MNSPTTQYQFVYVSIQNTPQIAVSESTVARDWRVYFLKPEFTFGSGQRVGDREVPSCS